MKKKLILGLLLATAHLHIMQAMHAKPETQRTKLELIGFDAIPDQHRAQIFTTVFTAFQARITHGMKTPIQLSDYRTQTITLTQLPSGAELCLYGALKNPTPKESGCPYFSLRGMYEHKPNEYPTSMENIAPSTILFTYYDSPAYDRYGYIEKPIISHE